MGGHQSNPTVDGKPAKRAILEREHFTVSQENKYFSAESLSKMIGQEPNQWRHAALKELIDNALDAAESVYPAIAPHILIEFTETENGLILSVADNGPGIAADKIPQIADFTANSSTKLFYRAPLRGAQGNALKTLIGIPVALGQEHGCLEIETRDWRHSLQAGLTPVGIRKDHQQTAIETMGTRFTATIPGPLECFYWEPARWIIAYGLFNPHATLQIRKIDPVFRENSENDEGQRAYRDFSDLLYPATVAFPDPWRKFLPTDHTPAHWYSAAEFKTLVYAKVDRNPEQTIGDFVQEFKGLSRIWRKVVKAIHVKTLGELINDPPQIAALHHALQAATPPKPEILGRVGPDHFRQRFDEHFAIVQDAKGNDRYWYKHQWGLIDDHPYLIEVAIAQTEQPGNLFYGLNYSVPFADPLAETRLIATSKEETIEEQGLAGFLRDAGVYCGSRYGKAQNATAAVHLVMPLLPTLDMGKTRLAIPSSLAKAIAETIAAAAKTLHKEIVDARLRQRKIEQRAQQNRDEAFRERQREWERERRQFQAEQDKEERQRQRQERQEQRAQEAEQRRLRGELPTKQDVVFELLLPTYLAETEQESLYISKRDLYYAIRPLYEKRSVRPSKKHDGSETTELDYNHFASLVAAYRRDHHPLPMLDSKARGTLFEAHSGREIPVGDRELRTYRFPPHQYAGVLVIEKEGVWATLKDTGGVELARKFDLLVLSLEGYNIEAGQKLLAKGQQEHGYLIFCWHDADPAGYNICRVLGEPTERLPDHHLDVIDIGLHLEEGRAMGLQTENFTRKKWPSEAIVPNFTDIERELFTGEYDKETGIYRNCQRIEINAIKPRDRVAYLERKISEAIHRPVKSADPDQPQQPPVRPGITEILEYGNAVLSRNLRDQARKAVSQRINLTRIEDAALATLPALTLDNEALQAALESDQQTPWREIIKQAAAERLADPALPRLIAQAVRRAIADAVTEKPETAS